MNVIELGQDGKVKVDWGQTSSLMALAVNLMRDPKKGKAVSPADFNPLAEKPPKLVLKMRRSRADRLRSSARAATRRSGTPS